MTARDLKALREALGLDHYQLAMVLGVHASSVYRWESQKRGQVSFERSAERLVVPLFEALLVDRANPSLGLAPDTGGKLGEMVRTQMIAHGELGGLLVIVSFIVENKANG